eukprot:augustus_masked-scaffold_10-processed-gene-13.51-mRNA-1 protein AED:0.18 eAED:0.19 QI:0/-1/0/1/-1/1/1/0/1786
MNWMAKDFQYERKTKISRARKVANQAKAYVAKLQKRQIFIEREKEKRRKATISKIRRMIQDFWEKITKLLMHEKAEELKKSEEVKMEKQLDKILAKTAAYSSQLAEKISRSNYTKKRIRPVENSLSKKVKLEKESALNQVKYTTNGSILKSIEAEYKASLPFLLVRSVTLRNYQRKGLDWLVGLYNNRLNGILADEMGLGKTLQTIALFAYLASYRNIWGPHLIIVPSSVLLNWELEFKRFCPGLKVLAYYGTPKERKEKRIGWNSVTSKAESVRFHVLVTSYKLAVQDHWVIKRKKWCYMVLDEAHHIKNFKSQRWQTLLGFKTKRRLLLTGTPLQNSLIELWSLLHFLMPNLFTSHLEFKHWFSNPLTQFIENHSSAVKYTSSVNVSGKKEKQKLNNFTNENFIENDEELMKNLNSGAPGFVTKLHSIIKPFILRRKKVEVLKELPQKFEHNISISLSPRQERLYEDFVKRKQTKQKLVSGGYLGMMQVMMKLRMVCNHPDIFEPRMVNSAHILEPLVFSTVKSQKVLRNKKVVSLLQSNKHFVHPAFYEEDVSNFFNSQFAVQTKSFSAEFKECIKRTSTSRFNSFDDRSNLDRVAPPNMFDGDYTNRLQNFVSLTKKKNFSLAQKFGLILSIKDRVKSLDFRLKSSLCVGELAVVDTHKCIVSSYVRNSQFIINPRLQKLNVDVNQPIVAEILSRSINIFHAIKKQLQLTFPDSRLTEFDSGKLIYLKQLLQNLSSSNTKNNIKNNKVLIFTQMTKMLDILEIFLTQNGFVYCRLDGSTPIRKRQALMHKFNNDPNLFVFILSTRSGGLGINLTGANNVVFFDSDWNPTVDLQAQDRAHRIGQTREVHIFRLISTKTIEENIFLKQKQKRQLSFVSVDFKKMRDELIHGKGIESNGSGKAELVDEKEFLNVMTKVEDEEDQIAMKNLEDETRADKEDFDDDSQAIKTADTGKNGTMKKAEKSLAELYETLSPIHRYGLNLMKGGLVSIQQDKFFYKLPSKDFDNSEPPEDIEEVEDVVSDSDLLHGKENDEEIVSDQLKAAEYNAIKDKLKVATKLRAINGTCWEERQERIIYDKANKSGSKTNIRKYYFNIDSKETTYLRPSILDAMAAYKKSQSIGWSALPESALLLIFFFLRGSRDKFITAKVCLNWYLASRSPKLSLWVMNSVDYNYKLKTKFVRNNFIVGDSIEVLIKPKLGGKTQEELYMPGVVSDIKTLVSGEVQYQVTYLNGGIEDDVKYFQLRRDSGLRYTFSYQTTEVEKISKVKNKITVRNLNMVHSSSFACGVDVLEMRFSTLRAALRRALPGDTIVLKSGIHKQDRDIVIRNPVGKDLAGISIRVIGELKYFEELQLKNIVYEKVWKDQLGLRPSLRNRLLRSRYQISKNTIHPLARVQIQGITSRLIINSPYAKLNGTEMANDARKRRMNFKHYELDDEEAKLGSILVMSEGNIKIEQFSGNLVFSQFTLLKQRYNLINPNTTSALPLITVRNCHYFLLDCCALNTRFFSDQILCISNPGTSVLVNKSILKNAKTCALNVLDGIVTVLQSQLIFNNDCAVNLSYGKVFINRCYFSNNKNCAVRVVQFFQTGASDRLYNLRNFILGYMRELVHRVESFQLNKKLFLVLTGNVTTRKQKGIYNNLPYPTLEVHLDDALNVRSKPIFQIVDDSKEEKFHEGQHKELDHKKDKMSRYLFCFNNMYSLQSSLKWQPAIIQTRDTRKRDRKGLKSTIFGNLAALSLDEIRICVDQVFDAILRDDFTPYLGTSAPTSLDNSSCSDIQQTPKLILR